MSSALIPEVSVRSEFFAQTLLDVEDLAFVTDELDGASDPDVQILAYRDPLFMPTWPRHTERQSISPAASTSSNAPFAYLVAGRQTDDREAGHPIGNEPKMTYEHKSWIRSTYCDGTPGYPGPSWTDSHWLPD
jgi:hypothetical protein